MHTHADIDGNFPGLASYILDPQSVTPIPSSLVAPVKTSYFPRHNPTRSLGIPQSSPNLHCIYVHNIQTTFIYPF